YEDYLFSENNMLGYSTRRQVEDEKEPNSEIILSYKLSFEEKGHELKSSVTHLDYWENSDQTYTESSFIPDGKEKPGSAVVQRAVNDEFEGQWLIQLDYTKPVFDEGNFEAGLRTSFRDMENDFLVSQQNVSGNFMSLPGMDDIFLYKENIH